ncbi:MAG TPA: radical SAM protein, partial [Vicinamibacterales bacterium]
MRILLLSMPDSFEHTPVIAMRMPNAALVSLAGNVDAHHTVAVADLILVQRNVHDTVVRLMRDYDPDIVGLSVMTFQRRTALAVVRLVRSIKPSVRVVAGGYDPSLAPEMYEDPALGIDFLVRGEGELTFRELLRAIERGGDPSGINGLSYRPFHGQRFRHTPTRPVTTLTSGEITLPNRASRVLSGYTFMGRPVDLVETSRGCTYDCSFCSIIEMRGRNFHAFGHERVLADIADARAHGARAIFIVDDNITLNVKRFEGLCRAIAAAGMNDVHYLVQAMTSSIAAHGETLAPVMREAGFRYVFLGIENILDDDLAFLKAAAKNAERAGGRQVGNASMRAIDYLHREGMFVVGGIIVGNPDDTRDAIEANLSFAKRYVDWPYIQHPTPYPGTPMTTDFVSRGLIVNERVEEYDGTTAVVRTEHLSAEDIEFMRWQADRWMKVRHMPASL